MSIPADILRRAGAEVLWTTVETVDPAAGAEWSIVVTGGEIWEVHSMHFSLTTDATVANRRVTVTLSDGVRRFARIPAPQNLAAGLTGAYTFCTLRSLGDATSGGFPVAQGFPIIPLLGGSVIASLTGNLQAGDNLTSAVLYVKRTQARGLSAELAYELFQMIREGKELDIFEREGF